MPNFLDKTRFLTGLCVLATLSACGPAPIPQSVNDPGEAANRRVASFNDKLSKPKAQYRAPNDLQVALGNMSDTLSMPQVAVNSLLQGDLRGVGISTYRFVINGTLGIAGVADVASIFGAPTHDTDFGETLHVWGVAEGRYVVLPILGPSTQRDTAGKIVDLVTNPLSYVLQSPESSIDTVAGYLSRRGVQPKYGEDLPVASDTTLDRYERQRAAYLAKRRADLKD